MITHLFTDLFGVLVFEDDPQFKTDLSSFTQLTNGLFINTELLEFYSLLKQKKSISLNVFTSAFYLIDKQGELSQKYLKEFDQLISSLELGYSKKETQAYKLIAQKVNTTPENCFFVDDQEVHVIKAKEAGITATKYLNNEQLIKQLRTLCQL